MAVSKSGSPAPTLPAAGGAGEALTAHSVQTDLTGPQIDRTAAPDGDDPGPVWDRLSAAYDRQLWLERSAVAAAVALLSPGADERCLDVGTGTGQVLRALRQLPTVPETVLGIDPSPAMLARTGGLPVGWSTRRGDVRHLDLPDVSFDAVTASYVLQLLTEGDLMLALSEIHRVLRAGGRLVTVTPAIPTRGVIAPLAAGLDALSRRRPSAYRGLRALDPRIALDRAGFTVERCRWNLRGYPSICVLARRPANSDPNPAPEPAGRAPG